MMPLPPSVLPAIAPWICVAGTRVPPHHLVHNSVQLKAWQRRFRLRMPEPT